ncbi:MAG: hypothetical protein WC760_00790 [Bacteroidia bacterium]|jgi:hypothetical protein
MKKLQKTFIYLGIASMLAFTSCKKDEDKEEDPTTTTDDVKMDEFSMSPSGLYSVPVGTQFVIHTKATGNAENNLVSIKYTWKTTTNGVVTIDDEIITLSGTSFENYDTVIVNEHGTKYEVSCILIGAKGNAVSSSTLSCISNTVEKDQPFLGNQVDTKAKFWSAKRKASYFLVDVKGDAAMQADMDFAYCTRTTGNKLIAPNSQDATEIYADQWSVAAEKITTWTVRNNTGFIKVNSKIDANTFNNDALSTDSLINVLRVSVGEPSNPSNIVVDGDIIMYRTIRGTITNPVYFYGLIYAASPTGAVVSGAATAGDVQLIVRYQREN